MHVTTMRPSNPISYLFLTASSDCNDRYDQHLGAFRDFAAAF
jgi:hypothetical protein